MTYTEIGGQRRPELGEVVLFYPKRLTTETVRACPAIIHYIVDASPGLVDLTLLADNGPKVKKDVKYAL
jgi:hypothetical protein